MKVLIFLLLSFFTIGMMGQDDAGKSEGTKSSNIEVTTTEEGTTLDNNTIIIIAVVGGVVLLGGFALLARNKKA